jgi:hypothetical protein
MKKVNILSKGHILDLGDSTVVDDLYRVGQRIEEIERDDLEDRGKMLKWYSE